MGGLASLHILQAMVFPGGGRVTECSVEREHRPPSRCPSSPYPVRLPTSDTECVSRPPSKMDFASLMAAQISESKSSSPPSDAQPPSASTSKYLKRSELEAQRQAAYVAEQARLEKERE